ncbi:MAG: class C sortase [Blautia sp.]|nr:class C sortase [Lachnoclostridium sp.]MCM1211616.1 class C sortase [Blautia sp.]
MRKTLRVLSLLVILLGACICMYPQASLLYGQYERKTAIREFEQTAEAYRAGRAEESAEKQTDEGAEADAGEGGAPSSGEAQESPLDRLYQDMRAYNEQIWQERQSGLKDAFSYEDSSFDLAEYGLRDNIIGVLWIPAMEVELPLYLGASQENLRKGAAVLGQTSMPIGGKDTNTVVAAHRGGGATPMFRNIQLLQTGDKIQVITPFDTLIYRVADIQVILPDEIDKVLIGQGEDCITLLTCHPYTKNSHRYLVKAYRSNEGIRSREADLQEVGETRTEVREEIAPVADELLDAAGVHYSEMQILLEKYGLAAGMAILLYFCVSEISGLVRAKRGKKREKERHEE